MQDTTRTNGRDDNRVWKGLAAGLIGGLVASWTMNRFQDVWSRVAKGVEAGESNQFQKVSGEHDKGDEETSDTQRLELGSKPEVPDDTTMKAASAVSEGVFGHKLTQSEKKDRRNGSSLPSWHGGRWAIWRSSGNSAQRHDNGRPAFRRGLLVSGGQGRSAVARSLRRTNGLSTLRPRLRSLVTLCLWTYSGDGAPRGSRRTVGRDHHGEF